VRWFRFLTRKNADLYFSVVVVTLVYSVSFHFLLLVYCPGLIAHHLPILYIHWICMSTIKRTFFMMVRFFFAGVFSRVVVGWRLVYQSRERPPGGAGSAGGGGSLPGVSRMVWAAMIFSGQHW
jgi:hypothetical protein